VLGVIGRLSELTAQVKAGSEEMLTGSREVIRESQALERVTGEISGGMGEMAAGSEQINRAMTRVNEISGQNRDHINALAREVAKFKV